MHYSKKGQSIPPNEPDEDDEDAHPVSHNEQAHRQKHRQEAARHKHLGLAAPKGSNKRHEHLYAACLHRSVADSPLPMSSEGKLKPQTGH